MRPLFQILANDSDMTEQLRKYFISATVVDDLKSGSDTLDLKFSNYVELPSANTIIKFSAGFDKLHLLGSYLTGENTIDLISNALTIKCKAVQSTGKIKTDKKTQTWGSVNLSDIVGAVAEDNDLKVRFDFPDFLVESEAQINETDLAFLYRLAREYGAYFSIKNETIIFIEDVTDVFYIDVSELSAGSITTTGTEYKSVRCKYFDKAAGVEKSVVAGSGSPEYSGRTGYSSRGRALGAANRKLKKLRRLYKKGHLSLPKGRPEIYAGASAHLTGSRAAFIREYFVSSARHIITPSGLSSAFEI